MRMYASHADASNETGPPGPFARAKPLRILLADDHAIFRQGVRSLLEREGFEIVAEAGDGQEAIRLAKEASPDVAILDLAMPGINGTDAAPKIADVSPQTRMILLTMYSEEPCIASALQAGMMGYVLKSQSATDLVQAIREVVAGGMYLSPGVSQSIARAYLNKHDSSASSLTSRESQVLRLVAEGKTTREVAESLGISVKTAESHRTRIMGKLDIHDTAGLVRYAIRQGVIQP